MDVRATIGDERMLRRVIALLVSFAALAERAAARSAPVRWLVLLILRHAEIVAEGYVFEAAGMPPLLELEGIAPVGNDPDDALSLAARFYALAAALCTLLPLACLFDPRSERPSPGSHAAPGSGRRPSGTAPKPNDTS